MKLSPADLLREKYRAQFAQQRSINELDGYGMPDRTLELRYHPPAQHGGVIVDSDHVYARVCPERLIPLPDGRFQTAAYELPEYWTVGWSYPSGFGNSDSVHATLEAAISRFDVLLAGVPSESSRPNHRLPQNEEPSA